MKPGGSVYLRLTTNPIEQPGKRNDDAFRQGAIDGAYWLRKPGPNCDVVIAYQGAVAPEAIRAAGMIAEGRRDIGVLAVTSADRLNAGWSAAQRARSRGITQATCHVESLMRTFARALQIGHRYRWSPGNAVLVGKCVRATKLFPLGSSTLAKPAQ